MGRQFVKETSTLFQRAVVLATLRMQPLTSGHLILAFFTHQPMLMQRTFGDTLVLRQRFQELFWSEAQFVQGRLFFPGTDSLSPNIKSIINAARWCAETRGVAGAACLDPEQTEQQEVEVTPTHLLLGILAVKHSVGVCVLAQLGVDLSLARNMLIATLGEYDGELESLATAMKTPEYSWVAGAEKDLVNRHWF